MIRFTVCHQTVLHRIEGVNCAKKLLWICLSNFKSWILSVLLKICHHILNYRSKAPPSTLLSLVAIYWNCDLSLNKHDRTSHQTKKNYTNVSFFPSIHKSIRLESVECENIVRSGIELAIDMTKNLECFNGEDSIRKLCSRSTKPLNDRTTANKFIMSLGYVRSDRCQNRGLEG